MAHIQQNPNYAVLVVEDDPLVRMNAVDMVSDAGFAVYEACSADEAISVLETHPDIHVLFTDIEMPGSMDGLKLAHAVRDRWPPITIMIASGRVTPDAAQMPEGGVFFSKPYLMSTLTNALNSAASRGN